MTLPWINVGIGAGSIASVGPDEGYSTKNTAAIVDAICSLTFIHKVPPMTLECINPENLPKPQTYTHVVVATGSRLVFVSGQEPEDAQGNLVGSGDLAAQARQVFANLGCALAAAGARPDQVTKITIYVVNHCRDYLPAIEEARVALFGAHKPADALLGIATLSNPEYLLEVDAIAVVDEA